MTPLKITTSAVAALFVLSLLAGCSGDAVSRSAGAAAASAADVTPDNFLAATDGSAKVGGISEALPFGIRNDLPGTTVRTIVQEVDPYDWATGDNIGTPASDSPMGFTNVVLASGDSRSAWFWPRSKSSNAPFGFIFKIGVLKDFNRVTMSFDEVYHCFTNFSGQQVPCTNFFSVKQWYGWAWRSADRNSVDRQTPQICNTTSANFAYTSDSDGSVHTGHGRLECASKSAGGLGNSIVLEEVK